MKNLFITGYDSNTNWMLTWFLKNHKQHSNTPILAYDFDEFKAPISGTKNWFKKPFAMLDAASKADKICWIDLDCHVKSNPDKIFTYIEKNKLAMVEDVPWSKRRGRKWHNSGIVGFSGKPKILEDWAFTVSMNTTEIGDQEVLHSMMTDDLKRIINITDLPREYNTLRIDLMDGTAPENPIIMHWTGAKGKEVIRGMINE